MNKLRNEKKMKELVVYQIVITKEEYQVSLDLQNN